MSGITATRKVPKINKDTLLELHKRQNGICIYCGRPVDIKEQKGTAWNTEHIVPRAVFKWLERMVSKEESNKIFSLIEDKNNIAIVHTKCNASRGSSLPAINFAKKIYASDELKKIYTEHISKTEVYIRMYSDLLYSTLNSQRCKCGRCSRYMSAESTVLRRRDTSKIRNSRNVIALCFECSQKTKRSKYGTVNTDIEFNRK
jgi:hypothetical protein